MKGQGWPLPLTQGVLSREQQDRAFQAGILTSAFFPPLLNSDSLSVGHAPGKHFFRVSQQGSEGQEPVKKMIDTRGRERP